MTDTCAHLALGWSEGEIGRRAAENLRESVTPGVFRAALDAVPTFDVSNILQEVKAPTLVFSRPNISWIPAESARNLTAKIPHSQLSILDGESTAPYLGDTETILSALQRFLDSDDQTSDRAEGVNVPTDAENLISGPTRHDRDAPPLSGLTERETQVLRMVAGGKTNNEVASELVLSIRTVERHIGNIYSKIDARGRADATVYALTHGIV
jgi:DNA-binding NarL/FixJ family response regulator